MPRRGQLELGTACVLAAMALMAAPGAAAGEGGAAAPAADGGVGGVAYGTPLAAAANVRPVATRFGVSPTRVTAGGAPPRIALRIDEPGVRRVRARVVFWPSRGAGKALRIDLGRIPTGRLTHPRWPSGATLVAGRYLVRVHASDPAGHPLRRRAHTSGRAGLTVRPAPVAPPAAPAPPAPATAPLVPVAPAGPVTPGTFPVQGPHSYGDLFGAARKGYSHQGVDVLAAEGTPILAPVAGTIRFTDYQASAGGYYVVQHAADGRDFFFAHCQKDSTAVVAGQAVAAGAPLCRMGHTGDASGPHLHFELWPAGWRTGAVNSVPTDPLAQLRTWDGH